MSRRRAALTTAGLALGLATLVPSSAEAIVPGIGYSPISHLPSGWSTDGTDHAFVEGPEGVPLGRGSLQFSHLVIPGTTPATDYAFDTDLLVPADATATYVVHLSSDQGFDYTLETAVPAATGWADFALQDSTPFATYDADGNPKGDRTWSDFDRGGYTVTGVELEIDTTSPVAYMDDVATPDNYWDFEPAQVVGIETTATTAVFGQKVGIGGSLADASGTPLVDAPIRLYADRAPQLLSYTGADGHTASLVHAYENMSYWWSASSGDESDHVVVHVAPKVVATVARATVAQGTRLVVSGSAVPLPAGTKVTLVRSGSRTPLATTTTVGTGSTYRFSVKAPRGTYLVSVRTAPTTQWVAGASTPHLVTVR